MLFTLGIVLFLIWLVLFGPMLMSKLIRKMEELEKERVQLAKENLAHPDMANDPSDGYHAGNFYWW